MGNEYVPSKEILEKYADVMVNFALNWGKGIKEDDTVTLTIPEVAKPFLEPLYVSILKAGGNPIIQYVPDDLETLKYEYGTDKQLTHFPAKMLKGRVDDTDHFLAIVANKNPKALKDVDPQKIMMAQKPWKQYRDWRTEKENEGKQSWSLCLYGTPAIAQEAGLSLEEYWDEIITSCYLDEENPVAKWQEIQDDINITRKKLNELQIEYVRVEAENTDITFKIGQDRQWLGGRGANVPSFEVFTTPDWRETNGHIEFNQPLYRYGNLIEKIRLEFENGIITKFSAQKNENLLAKMFEVEGANKIGEFSLTDSRLSRITKFMATTLYDENVGGEYGNMHLAIGSSFDEAYAGDIKDMNDEQREKRGFNQCAIHCDIMATTNRKATATLSDGSKKVIYENGKFTV